MSNNAAADVDTVNSATGDAVESESNDNIGSGIWRRAKMFVPDMSNLYLQPLDPSSDMTLSDRMSLMYESTRPVGEFLDLSKLNRPPIGHIGTRFGHNIETYLYNYLLLVCVHMVLFSLVHFGSVLVVVCWIGLVWVLFVLNKETMEVGCCRTKLRIDSNGKLIIAAVTGLLCILYGNVSTLIMSLVVFVAIVVGMHALLRDDVDVDVNMDIPDVTV